MLKRIGEKGINPQKISVIPPWSHDDNIQNIPHDKNPFRKEYNLMDKFVIMYSGNHSLIHPLNTLLESALRLRNDPRMIFLFVGGGVGVQDVLRFKEEHSLQNILYLPYQPREKLRYSLSVADLHVVVMGNKFVGIVHPCKIYGILAVGKPFVFIGPKESHVGDLISREKIGYLIEHSQTEDLIEVIYNVINLKDSEKLFIQQKSEELIGMHYSRSVLSPFVVSAIKKRL
ncbi:MAG: hypothetical protein A3K22_06440 [Deltaproteobacteria bacterium RBG_16_42_7]|nr:MAG: hypothetical protein A3K22_06440 [Deltaproteobacteria bacterium RBG_16_42_7]